MGIAPTASTPGTPGASGPARVPSFRFLRRDTVRPSSLAQSSLARDDSAAPLPADRTTMMHAARLAANASPAPNITYNDSPVPPGRRTFSERATAAAKLRRRSSEDQAMHAANPALMMLASPNRFPTSSTPPSQQQGPVELDLMQQIRELADQQRTIMTQLASVTHATTHLAEQQAALLAMQRREPDGSASGTHLDAPVYFGRAGSDAQAMGTIDEVCRVEVHVQSSSRCRATTRSACPRCAARRASSQRGGVGPWSAWDPTAHRTTHAHPMTCPKSACSLHPPIWRGQPAPMCGRAPRSKDGAE